MSSQHTNPETALKEKPVTVKAPYVSPVLHVYGSVSKLTMNVGSVQGDSGPLSMITGPSEPAIKENIIRVGDHPLGIGLYLFDYKPEYREEWGHGRQFGVMADEVEDVMPEAISLHADGYRLVNYTMLGVSRRIQ